MNNISNSNFSEANLLSLMMNDGTSLKEYIKLLRVHWLSVLIITLSALGISIIYAVRAPNIYESATMLRVSKPQGNILEAPLISEFPDAKTSLVDNEIEVLKSYTIREKVANALIDSLKNNRYPEYYIIFSQDEKSGGKYVLRPVYDIVKTLGKIVRIEQKGNLEMINISVESISAYEASLIANIYAKVYHEMNLNFNRLQMINVRQFLEDQSRDKHQKLLEAENSLKNYQEKGGIIALDEQSKALIEKLTDFESRRDAAKIELTVVEKSLSDYKKELAKQEPRIRDYMEKFAIEPYLQGLQAKIAQYELQRDLVRTGNSPENKDVQVSTDYNARIEELKAIRDKKLEVFQAGMLALSSDEVKQLVGKVLEAEIKYHGLLASYNELSQLVRNNEAEFNALPNRTIDLARLEREKGEAEKLYLLIQEKYQEAMINEQSTPGNVLIIDPGRIAVESFKPNRKLIVLLGLFIGFICGTGFVFIRNIFDSTVKTPEDIEKLNINLIGWLPKIEYASEEERNEFEFSVHKKPTSIASEAFRAVRTRIQFSKVMKDSIKTVLLTSASPKEGKTTTSVNLAGSFAYAGKKTVIVDCDLRKPRVHTVFKQAKAPGFTDYIFENASYDEIIRRTELNDLYLISSGTIPPNPSEILGSRHFLEFLKKLEEDFEVIIIDSPPILSVTDAEIISRMVDVSILVTSAGMTEKEVMKKAVELLKHDGGSFIGVLLNNFVYRMGYGSYYKNYYYYESTTPSSKKERLRRGLAGSFMKTIKNGKNNS